MKITAAGLKELAKLQPSVAEKVVSYQRQYKTRNCTFEQHPAGYRFYLGEGETYTFYSKTGERKSATMLSGDTIGAAVHNFSHNVNDRTPGAPEGTWAVEFQLFMGKPFITVHYVGQIAIP